MKVQWRQGGRRTLLGSNTDSGAVTLPPIRSQSAGFWISTGPLFLYTHSWTRVDSNPTCAGSSETTCCVNRRVSGSVQPVCWLDCVMTTWFWSQVKAESYVFVTQPLVVLTPFHVVPRLRTWGSILPLPHTRSWGGRLSRITRGRQSILYVHVWYRRAGDRH
jgi:hypothetical protein